MDFLSAAFNLTRWGWRVFPLATGQKIPAISKHDGGHGCHDATDDEEIIGEWSKRYPSANIGIATGVPSNIIVIDLDPRNGSEKSIEALRMRGKIFPATVVAQTANGGQHLYFAFEERLKNSKSVLAPGIDVKTTGGYVVAPPSVLSTGGCYRWLNSPLGEFIPKLPKWVIDALVPPLQPLRKTVIEAVPTDISGLVKFVENTREGSRNKYLFWATMCAAESGNLTNVAECSLRSAGEISGLDKQEIDKIIRSAKKRAGIS